jgi:hypothetical protein
MAAILVAGIVAGGSIMFDKIKARKQRKQEYAANFEDLKRANQERAVQLAGNPAGLPPSYEETVGTSSSSDDEGQKPEVPKKSSKRPKMKQRVVS